MSRGVTPVRVDHGFDVVDVVDVGEVVVVVGWVVEVVGGLTEVAVVGGGAAVVGGDVATTGLGMVDLGGWLVEVVVELNDLGVVVAGEMIVVTGAATGAEVVGVASLGAGLGIVGGGAGGAWSVTGGEVAWRTCWLRLGEDDMMPVRMVATVAMTTIVPTPTAMPTRGSPIDRENAERTARGREADRASTSSIEGGLPSPSCAGGVATSSARNTKDGFVAPSAAAGADPPSIAAAGDATASPIEERAWSSASMPAAAGAPMRRFGSDRRTSIACSCPSTDRRSPRFDDQVSWDSRMATTNRAVTRSKMPIPSPPPFPVTRCTTSPRGHLLALRALFKRISGAFARRAAGRVHPGHTWAPAGRPKCSLRVPEADRWSVAAVRAR
jgi:hypothetical protein